VLAPILLVDGKGEISFVVPEDLALRIGEGYNVFEFRFIYVSCDLDLTAVVSSWNENTLSYWSFARDECSDSQSRETAPSTSPVKAP